MPCCCSTASSPRTLVPVIAAALSGMTCAALLFTAFIFGLKGLVSENSRADLVRQYNKAVAAYNVNGTLNNERADGMAPANLFVVSNADALSSGGDSDDPLASVYSLRLERREVPIVGYTDDVVPFTSSFISASSVATTMNAAGPGPSLFASSNLNLTLHFEVGITDGNLSKSSFTVPFSPITNSSEELSCFGNGGDNRGGCSAHKMAGKCKELYPISGVYVGNGCDGNNWIHCGYCNFTVYATDVCVQLDADTLAPLYNPAWAGGGRN